MGSSLNVVARSPGMAERMATFLDRNTPEVLKMAVHPRITPPRHRVFGWYVEGCSIVLQKHSAHHGYDKVVGDALCNFAALKVGRHQRSFPDACLSEPFPEPVPYVKYDGLESWPVLAPCHQGFGLENSEQYFVDRNGTPQGIESNAVFVKDIPFSVGTSESSRNELAALCGLWKDGMLIDDPPDPPALEKLLEDLLEPVKLATAYLASLWT